MSGFTYRDAELRDAEAIADVARATWVATFGTLYPPEDLSAFLESRFGVELQRGEIADPNFRYRLAFRGDQLVGYCLLGALDMPVDDANAVEVHRLYVDESVKGAGVAQALMDYAIDWARGKKASAIYLSVWENNRRAQRFYRRYGFVDHGEWEFMVGRVADRDFIWKLDLGAASPR